MKKIFIICILLLGVVLLQKEYVFQKHKTFKSRVFASENLIKTFDLGLHSAAASFMWINTRGELPFLSEGYQKFKNDFDVINSLDAKLSTPYAYTVMVLPTTQYEDRFNEATRIGGEGTQKAVPANWKIPFYTAVTYHLYLKDSQKAAYYFDIAGHTEDVPDTIRRFSLNYGIYPTERGKTIAIWKAIYKSSNEMSVKERAEKYIIHFTILDILQKNVEIYKKTYGTYPSDINDLILKKFISKIPEDPFGFTFQMYEGGVVGIRGE